ncbi:MAG TPA: hypothetical protein VGX68_02930 [Thermoanaerobaculia bacterium]|jgi:hypothetical protein|nr:hypothetical protein [Thermoanaerobaculia bacterium]
MKRVWFAAVVLAFLATAAGFSQTPAPSVVPLSAEALAAILGQPAGTACSRPQENAVFAARRQGNFFKACSATATCNDTSGTNISCNFGGSGGTCTFQNQDCANGIQGFVNCNGTVTNCPACPCNLRPICCVCESSGDCFACCRCDGGTAGECAEACG